MAFGMVRNARLALLGELEARATRAEAEQQLWVDRARRLERQRIGKEMHEVADAIGQGWGNVRIAGELTMSVATVKAHVTQILAKLDVDNRVPVALLVQDARQR